MIVEFQCKNMKNYFENFEPKWPKSLKSGQIRNVNEFLKGFQRFYQTLYIKIELRIEEILKTKLRCMF